VNLLSKSMAVELGPDGIRVNAICPVMGATGMLELFMGMPDTPEKPQEVHRNYSLGRLSERKTSRRAAVFLASEDAEFITGIEFAGRRWTHGVIRAQ